MNIADFFDAHTYTSQIGENVAGGTATIDELHQALLQSGIHRHNMVYPFWRHIGVAIEENNGMLYMTQVFSP